MTPYRAGVVGGLLLLAAMPARAADAPPCSKFFWPVDHELALLQAVKADTASGTTLAAAPPLAVALTLAVGGALPVSSEKPSDPAKFSGYVAFAAPAAGDYLVSLSAEAWIDVIQDGRPVPSTQHSGDPDCPGLRKSVRFTLTGKPVTIEISNGATDRIELAVTPWFWGAK
ncbi:MAG: hypothetical protein WDM86_10170 [Rhizomicrobium sp.]